MVAWGVGKHESDEPHEWKIVTPPKESREIGKALFRCAWGQKAEQHVPIDPPDGEWHHFAVVYTGGSPESGTERLFFYVDGREVKQEAPEVPTPPRRPPDFLEATPLTFGARLSEDAPRHGKFLQGALDEVFIIEGALTAEQIQILYEKNTYKPVK